MTALLDHRPVGYAAEVARLLWPAPWGQPYVTRQQRRGPGVCRDFYIFPDARRPRLLLPAEIAASTSMLGRLGKGRSSSSRAARALLVRFVRSPAFSLLRWPRLRISAPPGGTPDCIDGHLATVLGRDVRVGVVLGTPRANQKPVLQIFTGDGELLGYAKVGHNELTAALVRREAETLAFLGKHDTTSFTPPRLLHSGQWHGLEVLVMSALSGSAGMKTPPALRNAAMRELATLSGTMSNPLVKSGFWSRLQTEVDQVPDPELQARLRATMSGILDRWGETVVAFGGWHGDWGHWNMALFGDTVQVWDWERYDPQVPLGFDALHHLAQRVRPGNRDFAEQQRLFLGSAESALLDFDVRPDLTMPTLSLYLLEISTRYALALGFASTPALQRRSAWSMALLEEQLTEPLTDHDERGRA